MPVFTTTSSSAASTTQVHGTLIRQSASPESEGRRRIFDFGPKRPQYRKPKTAATAVAATPEVSRRSPGVTSIAFTARPIQQDYTTRLTAVRIPAASMAIQTVSRTDRMKPERAPKGPSTQGKEAAVYADQDARENFRPLNFGERMLRNTAVCVAVLLCTIAIKSIDAPIAQTVSGELRDWVTMDLDESLGSLKFVQNILPDAALVFWHIGSAQTFAEPTEMALAHSWRENEPYLTYAADRQTPVTASAPGEVMSISVSSDKTYTVRVRHKDGLETIYGNLQACMVHEGDEIAAAQTIGASSELYFEIRGEGRSMNPVPLMAAKP